MKCDQCGEQPAVDDQTEEERGYDAESGERQDEGGVVESSVCVCVCHTEHALCANFLLSSLPDRKDRSDRPAFKSDPAEPSRGEAVNSSCFQWRRYNRTADTVDSFFSLFFNPLYLEGAKPSIRSELSLFRLTVTSSGSRI